MPTSLSELLAAYVPREGREAAMWGQTREFIAATPDCFERSCVPGHVTGSAWIVNRAGTRVLLIHHAKLDRWFQPGGHCDGDTDVLAVADREAREETGLDVRADSGSIFDVDVHTIPARGSVPEHLHYDIRFVFIADENAPLEPNAETRAAAWFDLTDAARQNPDESITRMIGKTRE